MKSKWTMLILVVMLAGMIQVLYACGGDDDDDDDDSATDDTAADDATDDTDDDDTPPTYPTNHDAAWDCMLCHGGSGLNGTPAEPHGDEYASPADCVTCHSMGDWVNDPLGADGHNADQDCLTCHGTQHDVSWEIKGQCLVCHVLP